MIDPRKILIIGILIIGLLLLGACSTKVKFKSIAPGEPMLSGYLLKPDGDGPFPAVVMLLGCDGPLKHYRSWAIRLKKWGYVTLRADSFGPRNESDLCTPERSQLIPPGIRALDAHGAKLYLVGLPFVDPKQIAVMGWSHGGSSTLWAVEKYYARKSLGEPFNAAIAFYPYCNLRHDFISPLLILIGEKDDWCPAFLCEILIKQIEHGITLKVYPEAHHAFDFDDPLNFYRGHWVGRNDEAASDALIQVKEFLDKHLK